jgi:prophage antirepressor-like protein
MLILKSRKPAAYAVKSMLSEEILPTIFRTAMYWVFPEPKTSADSEAGVSSEASEVA